MTVMRADSLRWKIASVELQHLAAVGTVSGVFIAIAAARNGKGIGMIDALDDGTRLRWRAPGSAIFGPAVEVLADGDYVLVDGEDADKFVRVTVDVTYLPTTPQAAQVLLTDVYDGLGLDDVTAAEATAGAVETIQVTIENASPVEIHRLLVWLDAATNDLEISDDGVGWVSPTSEATALSFGSLAAAATVVLHVKRTISISAAADPAVLSQLHARYDGL